MSSLSKSWDIPLLLLLSLVWASAFSAIKIAVPEVGPTFLVFTRCLIGAGVMLIVVILMRSSDWPKTLKQWLGLFFVGVTSTALPFYLISFAEQKITSSMAGILMTTGPLVVIVLGHFVTGDEKINKGKMLGVFLGLLAAIYLLREGLVHFDGAGFLHPLAAIGAAVCYAIGGLMAKRLTMVSSEVIAFGVLAVSAIVTAGFLLWQGELRYPEYVSDETWAAILWLGIMPSGLAFYMRYFLIKRNGYGFVSYVGYLIPLFAIVIGLVLLGEMITIDTFLAMLVIILGLFFTRDANEIPWSLSPALKAVRLKLN